MRLSGILILAAVFSLAVVVFLQTRDVTSTQETLAMIATDLREERVEGTRFDRDRALELTSALEELITNPETIAGHVENLKTVSDTAAGWAAGAASPSPELHASVALRSAASELRSYALRPDSTALDSARRQLGVARNALTVGTNGEGTTAPSGLVTEGVRDRLGNIEASQKERALEVDEDFGP